MKRHRYVLNKGTRFDDQEIAGLDAAGMIQQKPLQILTGKDLL
jgi:hypothetical protein